VSRHCFPRVRVSSLGAKWLDTFSRSPPRVTLGAAILARGCTCLPSWPPLYYHYRHRGPNVEAERDRVGGIFLLSPRVIRSRNVLSPRQGWRAPSRTCTYYVQHIFISREIEFFQRGAYTRARLHRPRRAAPPRFALRNKSHR